MYKEFLETFILVFVAEMGDKTQLMLMTLAAKYKIIDVLLGIFLGVLLNHGTAVFIGSCISNLIDEYLSTNKDVLFDKNFENDYWGLTNIIKAVDRRIGLRRLLVLKKKIKNKAALKIIEKRLNNYYNNNNSPWPSYKESVEKAIFALN